MAQPAGLPARGGAVTLAACQDEHLSPVPATSDAGQIYEAVLRALYRHEGGRFPRLYLVRATSDPPWPGTTRTAPIPSSLQTELAAAVRDLPAAITWVEKLQDVLTLGGSPRGGEAVVTLGSLQTQADGSVQVAGSIYYGNLGSFGTIYVLARGEAGWQITGTTGVVVMA